MNNAAISPQVWHVLRFNHFDPIWRRCWDRAIEFDGVRYASYRAIEERWISEAIASTADGSSCFLVECAWVLRHYLERHPEQADTLRRLAAEGRFELLGSGENIVDANLIHGELLTRNLALGTWWANAELGVRPSTGWHSDGFGSSAQMPQIFRQCGYDWLPAISYNTPDAPYWRGLDGSTIFFATSNTDPGGERLVHRLGVKDCYRKLAPCPTCVGQGCATCSDSGFVAGVGAELTQLPQERLPGTAGVILLWGEELMPGKHVADVITTFQTDHPDLQVRQSVYRDLRPAIADLLAQVDHPPEAMISSKVENNPSQSGCYVSRIVIKQRHRELEHALLTAEIWDTLLGSGAARDTLRGLWRELTLSGFHDAITSSHCDQAYQELVDLHRRMASTIAEVTTATCVPVLVADDRAITVFNHHGVAATVPVPLALPIGWEWATVTADGAPVPVHRRGESCAFIATEIPPLSAKTYCLAPAVLARTAVADRRIRCGTFTVQVDDHGILSIAVDGIGEVIDSKQFRFGELILEHDHGDPWATRSLDRTRENLGAYTRLGGIEHSGDGFVITVVGRHPAGDDPHRCADPAVTMLHWEQRIYLREGLDWIEVETDVAWYTHGRRLRLAFPSTTTLDRGVYEVPYGTLERDRYEGTSNHGGNAGGDWPALHWAGVQAPDHTFAVFNHGTPSYRVESGVVLVSVLRSPMLPYALAEPTSYVLANYHGMADHGRHSFRHAFHVSPGSWKQQRIGNRAAQFVSGLTAMPGALDNDLPEWTVLSTHTQMTAMKPAENSCGIVMRLVEACGHTETVRIRPPATWQRAETCTVLEDPGLAITSDVDGFFSIPLTPWQIASVRFMP